MTFDKRQSQRFEDVDAWRANLQGFDADMVQLDAGRLDLRWDTLPSDEVVIARFRGNRALSSTLTTKPGWRQFVMTFLPQQWGGMALPPATLTVFGVGREYRQSNTNGHSVGIVVREETLARWEPLLLQASNRPPERAVAQVDAHTAAEWQNFGRSIFDTPGSPESQGDPMAERLVHRRAWHLLLRSVPFVPSARAAVARRIGRARLAERVLAYIDQHAVKNPPVAAVAHAVGASPRAIELATQSYLGVTPKEYLLIRRLHCARSLLLTGIGILADAALQCGFDTEHWSRFTGQYRKLFGELPSVTLRRGRARAGRIIRVLPRHPGGAVTLPPECRV
jgi:AraC-like DNA-binding protein